MSSIGLRGARIILSAEKDQFIDIFLFDRVSGGAGLVQRINDENIEKILGKVRERLGGRICSVKGGCDRVCTQCLLDFRNKIEHDVMSRPHGLQMLEFIRTGAMPDFNFTSTVENHENISPGSKLVESLRLVYPAEYDFEGPEEDGTIKVISKDT